MNRVIAIPSCKLVIIFNPLSGSIADSEQAHGFVQAWLLLHIMGMQVLCQRIQVLRV
jgi:hypothetical protein